MYTLSINMWFQKLIRQFFFNLDKVVYGFITTVYDLLISIARTSVLSQADIINMADKIYKLLAVFMVFKVTFSLIMYVVNPDDFSDKSKGVSKLGLNIIISLALLILVPYMFSAAFKLQTIILEDNSLAELIMGNGNDKEQNSSFLNDAGDTIAFYSIQPFFLPNVSLEGLEECITIEINGKFNESCESALKNVGVNSTLVNNYKYGIENRNMGLTFRQDLAIATDKGNDNFIMDYRFILSTVLGVVIVLILITFCMDVALRSIKLSFLQLIAPIPIISYVDPKSGKDGMFKKWYQMCFKTYASLFLRLIALYFAVYIISRVGKLTDIVDGSQVTSGFIKIFIIIGALMFAKQLPKILEGLGIKLDSGFQLNPLRKIEKEALGGGLLKKPNDALAKFGKGILTSPINGVATLGKKTIGGIDSKANGGTFRTGFDNTHGKLYNNFYKKLDEWAPDTAEARKNRIKGEKNQEQRKIRENIGMPTNTKVNTAMDALAQSNGYRDGDDWKKTDYASYAKAKTDEEIKMFSNAEYRDSYKQLALAKIDSNLKKQTATDLSQKYQALLAGNKVSFEGKTYDPTNATDIDDLKHLAEGAQASVGSADGKVEAAKKAHEDVKLKYRSDSNTELAYDEYGKSHEWKNGGWAGSTTSSGTSSTGGSTTSSGTGSTSGSATSSGTSSTGSSTTSSGTGSTSGSTASSSTGSTSGSTTSSSTGSTSGSTASSSTSSTNGNTSQQNPAIRQYIEQRIRELENRIYNIDQTLQNVTMNDITRLNLQAERNALKNELDNLKRQL